MKSRFFLLFIIIFGFGFGQDIVLIQFTDKPSAEIYFDNPTLMLTQKALDRKAKYNIELDLMDVPVEEVYVETVESLGIVPIQVSKWFNGVFAWCTETEIAQLEALDFVEEVKSLVRNEDAGFVAEEMDDQLDYLFENVQTEDIDFDYGYAATQVEQINLQFLHEQGFTGEGITIAVLDNGFPGVDTADGFAYIRDNGQIKGGYNFTHHNEDIYGHGTHGTVVLSTIAGYIENEYIGTAIDADFYLFITENSAHEMPDEEINWLAAAEMADYLGVDVINTSLGYYEYDDSRYNYTYADMDGQTAYISQAAQIAAEKGMMVVVSAGNSGNKTWHYITTPADAEDVFTIGAVDAYGDPAAFTSFGPTSDGRIKPDVAALGVAAAVIRFDGEIGYSNGTSFSSPIMAGAMACLIQAFPNYHPADLRQKVKESANYYDNPTDQLGHGIPDFEEAYGACLGVLDFDKKYVKVYPNPSSGLYTIDAEIPVRQLQVISFTGKIVRKYKATTELDISDLPQGIYILKVQLENGQTEVKKLIKK